MLVRHTEVNFRDNQENRIQQFPKTPKTVATSQSSKFVTPAPKPRVALRAKSTNVHNRQFSSVKPGKRHSPIAHSTKPISLVPPEQAQDVKGGAALRSALKRALATGINVPDVEYAPPPVEELPYSEPDGVEPMDWEALRFLRDHGAFKQEEYMIIKNPECNYDPPPFEFIDITPQVAPVKPQSSSKSGSRRLGGFAAPTAAAQAKVKVPVRAGKENATSLRTRTVTRTSSLKPKVARADPVKAIGTTPGLPVEFSKLSIGHGLQVPALEPLLVPEFDPLPIMEVEYDLSDDE